MKKIKYIPIVLVIAFTLFWVGSLIKCEVLTLRHGANFPFPKDISSMSGELDYLKVLELSDTNALVYYVSSNHSIGDIATFIRCDNSWVYEKWEWTIWSTSGNADDFIWPYWYHSASGWVIFLVFGLPILAISFFILFLGRGKGKV